jgi:UDP-glucose 4-epimerase
VTAVLVTGAAGFVGAHLVRRIAERLPATTIVTADMTAQDAAARAFWAPIADRIRERHLDVTDRAAVTALLADIRPAYVVHAAAVTPSPDEERQHPARVLDVDLTGTLNVVDAATAQPGLARLIAFSSAAVYGNAPDLPDPLHETTPLAPTNLYGIAKAAGEDVVRRYAELRGASCLNVRVAGAYGLLERPTGSRTRMSQIHRLAQALAENRAVTVHGPNVPRDWVHADDVAHAAAALLVAPAPRHLIYNIGSGRTIGWDETVALFERQGLRVRWAEHPDQADIVLTASEARPALSIERLGMEIGYSPRRLEGGLVTLLTTALTGPVLEDVR